MFELSDYLEPLEYVYQAYLSNPYQDAEIHDLEATLQTPYGLIHRPNHGLAQTARVASYLPRVIDYFINYGQREVRDFCSSLSRLDRRFLHLALLFNVVGRQSDAGYHRDRTRYNFYRAHSGMSFEDYAQGERLPADMTRHYRGLVVERGNPNTTLAMLPAMQILNLCHCLDLLRCYDPARYLESIQTSLGYLPNDDGIKRLYALADQSLRACGNKQASEYLDGSIIDSFRSYDLGKFYHVSTSPSYCLEILAAWQDLRPTLALSYCR